MTLVSTERGVVGVIRKASEVSEDGAKQLLRLALYDAVCDLADAVQPDFERDALRVIAKQSEEGRRALVRSFIDRRASGQDVEDVIKAAAMMTLVEVGKADKPAEGDTVVDADPKKPGNLGRSTRTGRFASLTSALNSATSALGDVGDDKGSRYGGLYTAGALLRATGDPTATSAGLAVQAGAAFGPEAERVLGPGIQRAAYRYRGTERRPTRDVVKPLADAKRMMEGVSAKDTATLDRLGAEMGNEVVASTMQHYSPKNSGSGFSGEQRYMAVLGDVAAASLMRQLPSPEDARTSIATGRIPPSRGVMIDDEGDVVSEAVGMNGDHYVPFDLKNLGRLEGGQYVRTRAAGGPTTEDIYTGIMSGARQVQVVSHSGVFTLEMDPQLRGSRRYSDKARTMVRRYEEILSGIAGSKVTEIELPEAEKAKLRQQAINRTGSVAEAKVKYRELEQERLQELQFDRDEDGQDEILQAAVAQEIKGMRSVPSKQEMGRIRRDVANKLRDDGKIGPRALRLDGEGYARALNALAAEFPYFIRDVRHDTLRDFADTRGIRTDAKFTRGGTDQGYVSPGRNLARVSEAEDLTRRKRKEKTTTVTNEDGTKTSTTATSGTGGAPKAESAGDNAGLPNFGAAKRIASKPLEGALAAADPNLPPKARNAPSDAFRNIGAAAQEIENGALGLNVPKEDVSDYTMEYLETRPAYEVIRYIALKGGPKALLSKDADPKLQKAFGKAIEELRDDLDNLSFNSDETPKKAQEGLEFFEDFMTLSKPWGASASKTALLGPLGEDGKPLKIPAIVALGTRVSNYEAWEEDAKSNPEMARILTEGNHLTKIATLARGKKMLQAYVDDEDPAAESPITGIGNKRDAKARLEEIDRQLPLQHYAHAFDTAKNAASQLARLLSEEGEQSASPTQPPKETVSARWERGPEASGTHVRVHKAGSPLATEFRRFLASR